MRCWQIKTICNVIDMAALSFNSSRLLSACNSGSTYDQGGYDVDKLYRIAKSIDNTIIRTAPREYLIATIRRGVSEGNVNVRQQSVESTGMRVRGGDRERKYREGLGVFDEVPSSGIIAIGDLHGDLKSLLMILIHAKVIDDAFNWIGGNTYVVQLGDIHDMMRCPMESKHDKNNESTIVNYILSLDGQAKLVGGRVIFMIGNHEIMNLRGLFDYVSTEGMFRDPVLSVGADGKSGKTLSSAKRIRKANFKAGGAYAKKLARGFAIARIGPYLFTHAGLINNRRLFELGVSGINGKLKTYLHDGVTDPTLKRDVDLISKMLEDRSMVEMFKIHVEPTNRTQKDYFDNIATRLGGEHLIVGHTTHEDITSYGSRRLICIDTGLSISFKCYDNVNQNSKYLRIVDGGMSRHSAGPRLTKRKNS